MVGLCGGRIRREIPRLQLDSVQYRDLRGGEMEGKTVPLGGKMMYPPPFEVISVKVGER